MQLVINTKGTLLCRRGDRFLIRGQNNQTHEFSAKKIHSIVIATGVRRTSNIIQLAAEHNIDIVFLDSSGFPNSRTRISFPSKKHGGDRRATLLCAVFDFRVLQSQLFQFVLQRFDLALLFRDFVFQFLNPKCGIATQ